MNTTALVLVAIAGVGALAVGAAREARARSGRLRSVLIRARAARGAALAGGGVAAASAALSWVALRVPVLTLLVAGGALAGPFVVGRSRARQAAREVERAWSAALDQLADGLEAGLAFPAAAAFVAEAGPRPLAPRFGRLVERIRHGELEQALDELAAGGERTARSAAALLRAALVELPTGGLAPLLRELARVGRERFEAAERARTRSLALQREATVLAISPIAFLALIGWSAPGYLDAYRSASGSLVSLAGAITIGACYLAMLRLGRVPEPGRGWR